MRVSEIILYKLAVKWPSLMKKFEKVLGDETLREVTT